MIIEKNIGQSKMKDLPRRAFKFLIGDKAVKTKHIDDRNVTSDKIAPGAVGVEQLAPEAIHILKGGYKVVTVNQDITSEEQPMEGTDVDVIFVNGSQQERVVTIPSSLYTTSTGRDILLLVPVGGYAEANFVNVDGTIYVRGM